MMNVFKGRSRWRAAMFMVGTCAALVFFSAPSHAQRFPTKEAISLQDLSALVGGPTLVTFQGKDIPLKTAVTQLLEAAHLPTAQAVSMLLPGDQERKVTVDWKAVPFWEAAKDLENQSGLQWGIDFRVGSGTWLSLAGSHNGYPRREGIGGLSGVHNALGDLVASQIMSEKRSFIDFSNRNLAGTDEAVLQATAYFDPRLRFMTGSMRIQMPPPGDDNLAHVGVPSVFGANGPLGIGNFTISLGDQSGKTQIPFVRGYMLATVIVKAETWEIPDITVTKTAKRKSDGATYTLEDVSLDGDKLNVKISALITAPETVLGFGRTPIKVLDGTGLEVPSPSGGGNNVIEGESRGYRGEYSYDLRVISREFPDGEVRPGPFKLVWDIPTDVQNIKVPFEFRDVPLPK